MSENPVTKRSTRPARRSQAERSEIMRERLIEATLKCLETEGYAGTTISKIVETAQVSRGAPVHHFPSKAALIEAAAERLIRRLYIALGKVIQGVEVSDDRLHDLIMASWREVFGSTDLYALLEILVASKQEPELVTRLQHLWLTGYHVIHEASEHYFESPSSQFDVHKLMILTQWLLRGMAEDRYLNAETFFEHYLEIWISLLAPHIKTKPGIIKPFPGIKEFPIARHTPEQTPEKLQE